MSETVECWVFRADGPTEKITLEAVSDHLSEADASIRIELKDPDPKVLGNDQLGLHETLRQNARKLNFPLPRAPKLEGRQCGNEDK